MKVLIALDTSPSSQTVIDSVLHRPWETDSCFCVFNVVNVQRFERLPALIEDATRESEHLTDANTKKLRGAGFQAFSKTSLGNPRRDIACFAKDWGADLILVGSHGHGLFGRLLLGSVAQSVLRNAPCSVEIVRSPQAFAVARPYKLLFATDGSDCSNAAARHVASTIWPPLTTIRVLSVEELVLAGNEMEAMSISPIYPASLLEKLTTEARERSAAAVESATKLLASAGLSLDAQGVNPAGEPRGVILDAAKDYGADLIVMGSHGRRGWDRLLLGSVSEGVAVHATCSVRIVRSPNPVKGDGHAS